jgi:L,D-transpeptidase catalytic domain
MRYRDSLAKTLRCAAAYAGAMLFDRREMIAGLLAVLGGSSVPGSASTFRSAAEIRLPQPVAAAVPPASGSVDVPLWQDAMAALDRHAGLLRTDRLAIADFAAGSGTPRFHLVDREAGTIDTLHVAHGSGSDPAHSGFLHRFSNQPGSNATSAGAFVTRAPYYGQHGLSRRLDGLDPTNDQAFDRAIVLHAAWYAERDVLARTGKLGRSQGCFAFSQADLSQVMDFLGEGRLIYSGRSTA